MRVLGPGGVLGALCKPCGPARAMSSLGARRPRSVLSRFPVGTREDTTQCLGLCCFGINAISFLPSLPASLPPSPPYPWCSAHVRDKILTKKQSLPSAPKVLKQGVKPSYLLINFSFGQKENAQNLPCP